MASKKPFNKQACFTALYLVPPVDGGCWLDLRQVCDVHALEVHVSGVLLHELLVGQVGELVDAQPERLLAGGVIGVVRLDTGQVVSKDRLALIVLKNKVKDRLSWN